MNLILGFMKLNLVEKIAVLTFLAGVGQSLITIILGIYSPDTVNARNRLKYNAKEVVRNLKKESLFFSEELNIKRKFLKNMTVKKEKIRTEKYFSKVPNLRGSFLIMGEAGCGKTAILKDNFHKSYKMQCLISFFDKSKKIYYFSAEDLIDLFKNDNLYQDFLKLLNEAKLSKLFLYIDGVDELSDVYIKYFEKFIQAIRRQTKKTELRLSCRTEFANKYLGKHKFDYKLYIEKWNNVQLIKLSQLILDGLKRRRQAKITELTEIERYVESEGFPWDFINSPLLLKLMLYIKIYGQHDFVTIDNIFLFYSSFFNTLINIYKAKLGAGFYDLERKIDKAAESVFQTYLKHEKAIPYVDWIEPLMKPVHSKLQKVCLAHETFYEYLVARYYHNQFVKAGEYKKVVDVMKNTYPNAYADFITAAFVSDSSEAQHLAMLTMCRIYIYTLLPAQAKKFQNEFIPEHRNQQQLAKYIHAMQAKTDIGYNAFLNLKSEIVFRFGRFQEETNKNFRKRFLEFVYRYDTNVGLNVDEEYFIAILKRSCAISSSFIGGEYIELDYVKHMLNFSPYNYKPAYDLANRSHTLIYYGDVPNSDIFHFKDNAAENSWTYARTKRIERLAYPLPDKISDMNAKERKKYYFRMFDIATIYTFLRSRPRTELSLKEIYILSNFKDDFVGMSEERRYLLREVKSETLKLIHNAQAERKR